jgi:hypothetical protein
VVEEREPNKEVFSEVVGRNYFEPVEDEEI